MEIIFGDKLFKEPLKIIEVFDSVDILSALSELNQYAKKYWTAGYLRYDAFTKSGKSEKPLVFFGIYESSQEAESSAFYEPFLEIKEQLSFADYKKKFENIKAEIILGNTYQVNFTFDHLVKAYSSAENLFYYLKEKQNTAYAALIKNQYEEILSFSPELFFEIDGDKIWTKPMKGTAALDDKELLFTEKIKAENLMIVDLLRNDLACVADAASVKVESLLDIEQHKTLYQLTSTISAKFKEIDYQKIFQALFPCGSITGVPKLETMRVIKDLEEGDRGIYCGAIGYTSPEKKAVFSVPIRILQSHFQNTWQFRVGSGVVWDSDTEQEWQENLLKMQFLKVRQDFNLIETMLFDGENIVYLQEHLRRLEKSAEFFGFLAGKFLNDFQNITKNKLLRVNNDFDFNVPKIVRMELKRNGEYSFQVLELKELLFKKIKISKTVLDQDNIFLRHKTTRREWYQGEEAIFFNQAGELCETNRFNIFLEHRGELVTPDLESGLLPGILRAELIKKGKCQAKKLYLADLKKADKVLIGNSVRGLIAIKPDLK
ncbi:MAG: hypothetical protein GY817_04560 [bacterium]|nr:hypothetical protein [bacterium]